MITKQKALNLPQGTDASTTYWGQEHPRSQLTSINNQSLLNELKYMLWSESDEKKMIKEKDCAELYQ